MYIKYKDREIWKFAECREISTMPIDCDDLITQYNIEKRENIDGFIDSAWEEKAFLQATKGINGDCKNLICFALIVNKIKGAIIRYFDKDKQDYVFIVTNQPVFLMNEQGQTVDKLN